VDDGGGEDIGSEGGSGEGCDDDGSGGSELRCF